MTEEMIVNGVDVSGCKYAEDSIPVDCNIDTCFCYENNDCYYKQLKRLEQENQELGKIINCKNGTIANLAKVRDELKEENKKLKELLETRCYNEVEFENKKLKEKLEKTKEICKQAPAIDTELSLRILEVIEGAEDE